METPLHHHHADGGVHPGCKRCQLEQAAPDLLEFINQWEGHHLNCDYLEEGSPRTDCTCGYEKTRDEVLAKATE